MGKYFGTDGIRGVANAELSPEIAYKVGEAIAAHILIKNKDAKIVIGRDTRISGEMLESALTAGICSLGVDVIELGVIPTPGVAYLTKKYKADAGIVISASHNPVEYNGIKIFDDNGFKIDDRLENKIEEHIDGKTEILNKPTGTDVGKVIRKELPVDDYIDHLVNTIDIDLKGIKVALDCAEGAAYYCGPEVFRKLGAEVVAIHDKPDGTNINVGSGSTSLENIKKCTVENKCDLGLAFDGDADRCLAVDETGEAIDGDFIMGILAKHLKERGELSSDTLVVTVMSNMGLFIAAEKEGIKLDKTKVGDKYVLEEMLKYGHKVGGEQSGHIILIDHGTTGDGILTGLYLSMIVKKNGEKLSKLKSFMKKLPQVLININVPNDKKLIYQENKEVIKKIKEVDEKLEGRGRTLIRHSGTEPLVRVMLEGEDLAEIEQLANEIIDVIKENL